MRSRSIFSLAVAFIALGAALTGFVSPACAAEKPAIRVVVWDEQQPAQQAIYPNFIGNYLAEQFRAMPGVRCPELDRVASWGFNGGGSCGRLWV